MKFRQLYKHPRLGKAKYLRHIICLVRDGERELLMHAVVYIYIDNANLNSQERLLRKMRYV